MRLQGKPVSISVRRISIRIYGEMRVPGMECIPNNLPLTCSPEDLSGTFAILAHRDDAEWVRGIREACAIMAKIQEELSMEHRYSTLPHGYSLRSNILPNAPKNWEFTHSGCRRSYFLLLFSMARLVCGVIPRVYADIVDPFIALARASAVTSTIKLGTGICLVPERNPLLLAKEVATLDMYSDGRFLFGIGAGWHREETEIMGGDFSHRWTQTREAILAMKELWTKVESEYHGEYYDFPPVYSFPRPSSARIPVSLVGWRAMCSAASLTTAMAGCPIV